MEWQPNPFSLILWAIALVAAMIGWAAWRRRPKPGSVPLVVLMLGLAHWSFFYGLEMLAGTLPGKLLWSKLQYVGIVLVPAAWLALVVQYTGLDARWITRRNVLLLVVEPVATVLLCATNEMHGWVWREVRLELLGDLWVFRFTHAFAFWIHTAYSYVLLVLGVFLLIRAVVRRAGPYRAQAGLLLAGAVVPWAINGLSISGWLDVPFDLTAFGFTVTGLASFWALFHYQLLDLSPVARDAAVESMRDAMLAIDTENRIVGLNRAATELLGQPASSAIGRTLASLLPQYRTMFEQYREFLQAQDELCLDIDGQERWYDMQLSALYDRQQRLQGRLLVFRDISERKELEAILETQVRRVNQLLEVARATIEQPTLQNTLDIAVSLTMADKGSIFLVDAQHRITQSILTRDEASPLERQNILGEILRDGLAGWVLREQRTAIVEDAATDARWITLPDQPYEVGSVLGVPIGYGDRGLGVLILLHQQMHHFTRDQADTLEAAARQIDGPGNPQHSVL